MGKFIRAILATIILVVVTIVITGCGEAQDVITADTSAEDIISLPAVEEPVEFEELVFETPETFTQGIDISQHQGNIDETKLDASVIVVRLGYSGYGSGACRVDNYFMANMNKLANYNGKIALYWASHAITVEEVKAENEFIMNTLKTVSAEVVEKLDYLFIDREQSGDNGRADKLSKNQFNLVLSAQVKGLQEMLPDMKIGVYTNVDYLVNMVDRDALGNVPYWMAWYTEEAPASFDAVVSRVARNSADAANYLSENIVMWQYTDKGVVSGITENTVDINLVSSKMLG